MKKIFLPLFAVLAVLLMNESSLHAQAKYDDSKLKVLVDNEFILAVEVVFEPGERTPVHTHPAHFIYAFTDGTLEVTFEDPKEVVLFEVKAGKSEFSGPERPHSTVNIGNTPVRALLIELKEHPYTPEMNTKK